MSKYKIITAIDADDLEVKLNECVGYELYSCTLHPYSFNYIAILIKEKF